MCVFFLSSSSFLCAALVANKGLIFLLMILLYFGQINDGDKTELR